MSNEMISNENNANGFLINYTLSFPREINRVHIEAKEVTIGGTFLCVTLEHAPVNFEKCEKIVFEVQGKKYVYEKVK